MIINRLLSFRPLFRTNCLYKSLKIKCLSTASKSETKTKTIQEIKDFVIKPKNFDPNSGDLKKAVLLYANEKSTFFRRLFILNVCQGFFWIYLANVGITFALKKHRNKAEPQNEDKSVKEFFQNVIEETKILWTQYSTQFLLSLGMIICGQISISLFTLFTIRSVRYIILSPGARNVRITTFSVTGSPNRYRNYDVPIENVSAFQYRSSGGSYIPLKVKGKWFYFLVDSNGQFFKPSLFDQTVGVFRVLK